MVSQSYVRKHRKKRANQNLSKKLLWINIDIVVGEEEEIEKMEDGKNQTKTK